MQSMGFMFVCLLVSRLYISWCHVFSSQLQPPLVGWVFTHCVPPLNLSPADLPHNRKRKEGSWIGSLSPGPKPSPEAYPLDCCDWGVYVRFHGSTGQVRHAAKQAVCRLHTPPARLAAVGCTPACPVGLHSFMGLPTLLMQYQGAYGADEMATWAGWAHKWTAQGRETWWVGHAWAS